MLLLVADSPATSASVLGELRRRLGERLGLIDPDANVLTWIVDWPLLGWRAPRTGAGTHGSVTPPRGSLEAMTW